MTSYYAPILLGLLVIPWINPFAPGPSPAALPLLVSWFCILAIAGFAVARRMAVERLISVVVWSWLIAGLISCAIGVLQYFGAAADLSPWINQPRYGEAFANLRQRNQFATLTGIALAAFFWLIAQAREKGMALPSAFKSPVLLAFLTVGLLAVGNAISSSRTGLFQLVLLCALYGLWGQWRHAAVRHLLLWAVLVYAVAAITMPVLAGLDLTLFGVFARLKQDDACGSRMVLWSNVLHLIAQKPWLGWGWGELDYAHFITLYHGPRFCDILDNAHNLPLHLAVELGLPFALLVCGGFTWWVLRQKPWAERDATRQMAWAVIALILLHSMLEYPLWYGPFQIAFGLCVFLLWQNTSPFSELEKTAEKTSNWPLRSIIQAQTAIIFVAFVAYAAWDYRRISQIYLLPEARDAAYRDNTLVKIRSSWLFADQVQFAELLVTPLTAANAAWTRNTAGQVLHYSPEPRVIEKLIESALLLNKQDDALAYVERYRAAFPKEHAAWAKKNQKPI